MQRRELVSMLGVSALASAGQAQAPAETRNTATPENWTTILSQRLPLYGHRNWIVIADSAYPEQSRNGIETIVSDADHLDVLKETLKQISASRHVRAIVHQDQELQFVSEQDAPGVEQYRKQLAAVLHGANVNVMPHEEVIKRLAETAQDFNVLIIKTTLAIPYTSVFLQLDCAYWPAAAEKRLREAMGSHHE